jgi:hypothetical protein
VGILYIETREVEVCVCILYYIAPLAWNPEGNVLAYHRQPPL